MVFERKDHDGLQEVLGRGHFVSLESETFVTCEPESSVLQDML